MADEFADVGPVDVIHMDPLTFSRYMKHLNNALGRGDQEYTNQICREFSWEIRKTRSGAQSVLDAIREAVELEGHYAHLHHAFKYRQVTITTGLGFSIEQNFLNVVNKGESLLLKGRFDEISINVSIPFGTK